ncbi:uncharacterized protein LOC111499783 [Cucurbita maxima]|uniref:Uncharacterized protein LOC111499783 n=1 Tax=Cucurbita maxima TaxID=3661 RepID=A0A6J1KY44_CUCMA|nr:uncharacterized protein LOC111499783 [Cucurbita maxima]
MLGTANLVMGSSSAAMLTSTQCTAMKSLASFRIGHHSHCRALSLPSGLPSASGFSSCFFASRGSSPAAVNDQLVSSYSAGEQESNKYHFVVANAKFMLDEEEHFRELLFERLRYYAARNKEQDFWLVIEPKFLERFPNITKRLQRPAVALVSTNSTWITFMKLRLDRVLAESYEADSLNKHWLLTRPTSEFEKPEKWAAPYPKYEYGWWEISLPPVTKTEAEAKV